MSKLNPLDLIERYLNDEQLDFDEAILFYFNLDEIVKFGNEHYNSADEILQYYRYIDKEFRKQPNYNSQLKYEFLEELQREIDYMQNEVEIRNKIGSEIGSTDKIDWLGNKEQLTALYDGLTQAKEQYLKVEFESFAKLFLCQNNKNEIADNNAITKIQWFGTNRQLIYLFEKLSVKEFIPNGFLEQKWQGQKIISNCFLNKNGKPISNISLSNAKKELTNVGDMAAKRLEEILEIVKSIP